MSNASNLGYNYPPNSNVNNTWVNKFDSNNPAPFSSNESGLAASGGHGMMGAVNNNAAANSCLSGYCNLSQKGGKRRKKNMYSKYNRKYRMKNRSKRHRRRSSHKKKRHYRTKKYSRLFRSATKSMMGGYHQYQGNVPNTPSYSVGNVQLNANNSALANPAPFTKLGCEGSSCVDNYNHYTNKGFQLWN